MKSDIEKIYLIDRFLKGELSGLTLDEFKNRMRSDEQFAMEVETQRAIIEGIKLARREHLISVISGQKVPQSILNTDNGKTETKEIIEPEANSYKTTSESDEIKFKLKPNYNDWYLSVAAVLLAGLVLYAVFGYFIPHQKLNMAISDTSHVQAPITENNKLPIETSPVVVEGTAKDTVKAETPPIMANNGDSIKIEKDKKISETMYSVAAFETIAPSEITDPNVSAGDNKTDLKLGIRKVRGSTIKVEYWQSVVSFKGYKLRGSNLQLFETKPEESVILKYLDKQLFLKKDGSYYKLNASGKFEQFQKEDSLEIIKTLESN